MTVGILEIPAIAAPEGLCAGLVMRAPALSARAITSSTSASLDTL